MVPMAAHFDLNLAAHRPEHVRTTAISWQIGYGDIWTVHLPLPIPYSDRDDSATPPTGDTR
jgi:hypothetical protein